MEIKLPVRFKFGEQVSEGVGVVHIRLPVQYNTHMSLKIDLVIGRTTDSRVGSLTFSKTIP